MITPVKPDPRQPGVGPTGDSPRSPVVTGKVVQPTGVGGHKTTPVDSQQYEHVVYKTATEGMDTPETRKALAHSMKELPQQHSIHATGGTLDQTQDETQRALVAGETRSKEAWEKKMDGFVEAPRRLSLEAELQLWITECHMNLPAAESVHWTTHLRNEIPKLLERLSG